MNGIMAMFLFALTAGAAGLPAVVSADEILLGRVAIERSMMQSGGATADELVITAGRHDGASLTVDKGKADAMSLYLSKGGREGFVSHLRKLVEWGETARKEKIDAIKAVGTVSCQMEFGRGSAVIATRFISSRSGASWLGQIRFCQLPAEADRPADEPVARLCDRDQSFYLRPSEAAKLIGILGEKAERPGGKESKAQ